MTYAGIDAHELTTLGRDLVDASAKVQRETQKVGTKAAVNIKKAMVADAESSGHYKHFSRSISYDEVEPLLWEIGPDKDGPQGALGNLLYFGSANNGPVLDIEVGINEEAPRLDDQLASLASRLAAGRG